MFCANCERELSEGHGFCAHCGTSSTTESVISEPTNNAPEKFSMRSAISSVGQAVNRATNAAGNIAGSVATQLGDLNGDGKVDAEDMKIAIAGVKGAAASATNEVGKLGKEALQSEVVKDAAAGAAVGAVVAIPIPFVGPIAGATVGAVLGAYKGFMKK